MAILLIWPEFLIGLFLTGKDAMFAEVMVLALPMLLLTLCGIDSRRDIRVLTHAKRPLR